MMPKVFVDRDKQLHHMSRRDYEDARELGNLIQYCYTHTDEIKSGNIENMAMRASCILRERDNCKSLSKTLFEGVMENPRLAQNHSILAANMIAGAKPSEKLPNPKQILKDHLLEVIRDVERFVRLNIDSTKVKVLQQIIGIVSLIGNLYCKDLVDGEIIFNWIVNVLVTNQNNYLRVCLLWTIRERIQALMRNEKVDSVTAAVDKIIKKEDMYEYESVAERDWDNESLISIDESDGTHFDYIEWFKVQFKREMHKFDLANYNKFPPMKKMKFARAFRDLIEENFRFIPQLALFFEQFLEVEKNFEKLFSSALHERGKEIKMTGFMFWVGQLRAELCLLGIMNTVDYMKRAMILIDQDNDICDITLLLSYRRLGKKLKKLDFQRYKKCHDYVRKLWVRVVSRSNSNDNDLLNLEKIDEKNLNCGFEILMTQVLTDYPDLNVNFIMCDATLHAKVFFKKALENPAKHENFAKLLKQLKHHPQHEVIVPKVLCLCEEKFFEQHNTPVEENADVFPLVNFVAELFNVGLFDSKQFATILSTLSENNCIVTIFKVAQLTKEKAMECEDASFEPFKRSLMNISEQELHEIIETQSSQKYLTPDQKFVIYLKDLVDEKIQVDDFDESLIQTEENAASIAKILIQRSIYSAKLLERFSDIFKCLTSHSKSFEDAFRYVVMPRASSYIANAMPQKKFQVRDYWSHAFAVVSMIATLYKENIVENFERLVFKLLMEIRGEVKANSDYYGMLALAKLFKQVVGKFKEDDLEMYLQVMDIAFEMNEVRWARRNALTEITIELLADFDKSTEIDAEGGKVNPSLRLAIYTMTKNEPFDWNLNFVSIFKAKDAANCYFNHTIKHFLDTNEFLNFLLAWSKLETKSGEKSRFIPEILNACMRGLIEQHVQNKGYLNPGWTITTAKFIGNLFKFSLMPESMFSRFADMMAENTALNMNETNFNCLQVVLPLIEDKNKQCEFNLHAKIKKLIHIMTNDTANLVKLGEIHLQSEPEDLERLKVVNDDFRNHLDAPVLYIELMLEKYLNTAQGVYTIQTFIPPSSILIDFGETFKRKIQNCVFLLAVVPQAKNLNWEKLTKMGKYLVHMLEREVTGIDRALLNELIDKTSYSTKDERVGNLDFARFMKSILNGLRLNADGNYVMIIDSLYSKKRDASEEYKEVVDDICRLFETLLELNEMGVDVSPTLKLLVHSIVTGKSLSEDFAVRIYSVRKSAKFFFENAVLYPLSCLKDFVAKLKHANENSLDSLIPEIVKLCKKNCLQFQHLRRDVGVTKLITLMAMSGLYPEDEFQAFIHSVNAKFRNDPSTFALLHCANSVNLLDQTTIQKCFDRQGNWDVLREQTMQRKLLGNIEHFKTDRDLEIFIPDTPEYIASLNRNPEFLKYWQSTWNNEESIPFEEFVKIVERSRASASNNQEIELPNFSTENPAALKLIEQQSFSNEEFKSMNNSNIPSAEQSDEEGELLNVDEASKVKRKRSRYRKKKKEKQDKALIDNLMSKVLFAVNNEDDLERIAEETRIDEMNEMQKYKNKPRKKKKKKMEVAVQPLDQPCDPIEVVEEIALPTSSINDHQVNDESKLEVILHDEEVILPFQFDVDHFTIFLVEVPFYCHEELPEKVEEIVILTENDFSIMMQIFVDDFLKNETSKSHANLMKLMLENLDDELREKSKENLFNYLMNSLKSSLNENLTLTIVEFLVEVFDEVWINQNFKPEIMKILQGAELGLLLQIIKKLSPKLMKTIGFDGLNQLTKQVSLTRTSPCVSSQFNQQEIVRELELIKFNAQSDPRIFKSLLDSLKDSSIEEVVIKEHYCYLLCNLVINFMIKIELEKIDDFSNYFMKFFKLKIDFLVKLCIETSKNLVECENYHEFYSLQVFMARVLNFCDIEEIYENILEINPAFLVIFLKTFKPTLDEHPDILELYFVDIETKIKLNILGNEFNDLLNSYKNDWKNLPQKFKNILRKCFAKRLKVKVSNFDSESGDFSDVIKILWQFSQRKNDFNENINE